MRRAMICKHIREFGTGEPGTFGVAATFLDDTNSCNRPCSMYVAMVATGVAEGDSQSRVPYAYFIIQNTMLSITITFIYE